MKTLKQLGFAAFISVAILGCSSTQNDPAADGSSIEKAIKVKRVRQEYKFVEKACPDCKIDGQALVTKGENHYHRIICTNAKGQPVDYYFNINHFY